MVDDVSSYLGTITIINVALGLIVALAMHALGMPFPLMWGGIVALLGAAYFGWLWLDPSVGLIGARSR